MLNEKAWEGENETEYISAYTCILTYSFLRHTLNRIEILNAVKKFVPGQTFRPPLESLITTQMIREMAIWH